MAGEELSSEGFAAEETPRVAIKFSQVQSGGTDGDEGVLHARVSGSQSRMG
jgi:hypothetical protein